MQVATASEPPVKEPKVERDVKTGKGSSTAKLHQFSVDAPPFDPTKQSVSLAPLLSHNGAFHDEVNDAHTSHFTPRGWDGASAYNMVGDMSGMHAGYAHMRGNRYAGMPMDSGLLPPPPPPPPPPLPPPPLTGIGSIESGMEKDGLSVHAKPWMPKRDDAHGEEQEKRTHISFDMVSWIALQVQGKRMLAPVPVVPREMSGNPFVHSLIVAVGKKEGMAVELFYYVCARCALRTLYGRLWCRKADFIVKHVASDIPPICVAHLIEQVANVRVAALCPSETNKTQYDVWLDRPNIAFHVTIHFEVGVWTCPLFHGYAICCRNEETKTCLGDYLTRLRNSEEAKHTTYPLQFVEITEE